MSHAEIVLHEFGPQRRFGYVVDWAIGEVSATATVYRIIAVSDDPLRVFFESKSKRGDTDTLEDAIVFMTQHVKWDGCINTDFERMFHVCEAEDLRQLGELFKYIYNKAIVLMGREGTDDLDPWEDCPPVSLPPTSYIAPPTVPA